MSSYLFDTQKNTLIPFDLAIFQIDIARYLCASKIISIEKTQDEWLIHSEVGMGISRLTLYFSTCTSLDQDYQDYKHLFRDLLDELEQYLLLESDEKDCSLKTPQLSSYSEKLLEELTRHTGKNLTLCPAEELFDQFSDEESRSVMEDVNTILSFYHPESYMEIIRSRIGLDQGLSFGVSFVFKCNDEDELKKIERLAELFKDPMSKEKNILSIISCVFPELSLEQKRTNTDVLNSFQRKKIRRIERSREKCISKIKFSNDIEQYGDTEQAVLSPYYEDIQLGVLGLSLDPFTVNVIIPEPLELLQPEQIYTKQGYQYHLDNYRARTRELMIVLMHNLIRKTKIGNQLKIEFDQRLFLPYALELIVEGPKAYEKKDLKLDNFLDSSLYTPEFSLDQEEQRGHQARNILKKWLPVLQGEYLLDSLEYVFPWETPEIIRQNYHDQDALWHYIFSCLVWYKFQYRLDFLYRDIQDAEGLNAVHSILEGNSEYDSTFFVNKRVIQRKNDYGHINEVLRQFFDTQVNAQKGIFDSALATKGF